MTKYQIFFGECYKANEFNNVEKILYIDNTGKKKIKDLKDFITCYDDTICSCMLKYYQLENGFMKNGYKEYEKSNEDELKLKDININSCIAIMKIKNKCDCNFMNDNKECFLLQKKELIDKIVSLKENIENLKNNINDLEKKEEWETSKKKNYGNFYDIVVDINSILKLKKGWEVEMTSEGEQKYDEFKNVELIKIGIVGNMNKGKTFILSKLSKILLPSGTSINTKGISVKYPNLEEESNKKFILLDSAGLETPILKKDSDAEEEEENDKEGENTEDKKFREKARDILITESFLQNFIIVNSDILLLVVDNLNYSEQKLINKIKDEIKRLKQNKKLFVIHNLKTYRNVDQVKYYIDNTLLKSGTFTLQKHEHITAERSVLNGEHFTERDQKNIKVYHLIFAADGSEAGDYYNSYTIKFIENQYTDVFNPKKFDIIKEIKEQFINNCHRFLKEKLQLNDLLTNEEILENKVIKLKEEKDLTLKRCFIDEIGSQTFKGNGFEPAYNFFRNGEILEIRVELPGNVKPNVHRPEFHGENTIILIEGKKNRDKEPKNKEDNINDTRDFGDFNIDIIFKTEDYKIKPTIKKQDLKKGILFLQYDLEDDKSEDRVTSVQDDEEI